MLFKLTKVTFGDEVIEVATSVGSWKNCARLNLANRFFCAVRTLTGPTDEDTALADWLDVEMNNE